MMKSQLVSVVIPAYNAEKTIIDCLDSIYHQTYPNLEIIVVNDGSVDQTLQLLETYQKEHLSLQLRVFNQKNSGPSVARNFGVAQSKGEYIAFLDADDRWVSDKIENQMKIFNQDNEIGLVGGLIAIGNLKEQNLGFEFKEIRLKALLFKNYFATSTVICKREALNGISFNVSQKYAEDYRVWLEITSSDVKCGVLQRYVTIMNDKPLYGCSGLSANLWGMEKGEISNFSFLRSRNDINVFNYWCACTFSFVKYIRRILIASFQ